MSHATRAVIHPNTNCSMLEGYFPNSLVEMTFYAFYIFDVPGTKSRFFEFLALFSLSIFTSFSVKKEDRGRTFPTSQRLMATRENSRSRKVFFPGSFALPSIFGLPPKRPYWNQERGE